MSMLPFSSRKVRRKASLRPYQVVSSQLPTACYTDMQDLHICSCVSVLLGLACVQHATLTSKTYTFAAVSRCCFAWLVCSKLH